MPLDTSSLTTIEIDQFEDRAKKKHKRTAVGETLISGIGAAGGVSAAGTIASAAGASTLCGSTALASALGGIFVTTTPIGWTVGAAIAGVAVAGLAGKAIKSGVSRDYKNKKWFGGK